MRQSIAYTVSNIFSWEEGDWDNAMIEEYKSCQHPDCTSTQSAGPDVLYEALEKRRDANDLRSVCLVTSGQAVLTFMSETGYEHVFGRMNRNLRYWSAAIAGSCDIVSLEDLIPPDVEETHVQFAWMKGRPPRAPYRVILERMQETKPSKNFCRISRAFEGDETGYEGNQEYRAWERLKSGLYIDHGPYQREALECRRKRMPTDKPCRLVSTLDTVHTDNISNARWPKDDWFSASNSYELEDKMRYSLAICREYPNHLADTLNKWVENPTQISTTAQTTEQEEQVLWRENWLQSWQIRLADLEEMTKYMRRLALAGEDAQHHKCPDCSTFENDWPMGPGQVDKLYEKMVPHLKSILDIQSKLISTVKQHGEQGEETRQNTSIPPSQALLDVNKCLRTEIASKTSMIESNLSDILVLQEPMAHFAQIGQQRIWEIEEYGPEGYQEGIPASESEGEQDEAGE